MPDIKAIQNIIYEHPETGFPDDVKRRVDSAVSHMLTKVWRGTLEVAASGFGKGMLATAGIVLAAGMIYGGIGGFLGNLPGAVPGAAATVDAAVKMGLSNAISFLGSIGGLLVLAVGGAMGSIGDTQKYQDKMTAEMARVEAARLEQLRNRTVEKPLSLEQMPEQAMPQAARTKPANGRAALSVSQALHTGEVQFQPSGHAKREEERRIAREILGRAL